MNDSNGAIPAVIGVYWLIQYMYFVQQVRHYGRSHSHRQTLEYANAIRPTLVASLDKIVRGLGRGNHTREPRPPRRDDSSGSRQDPQGE